MGAGMVVSYAERRSHSAESGFSKDHLNQIWFNDVPHGSESLTASDRNTHGECCWSGERAEHFLEMGDLDHWHT